MKKLLAVGWLTVCVVAAQAAVTVSNLDVSQREGTKLVDLYYEVTSDATNSVTVSVAITNGAVGVNAPSLSGDVGSGVATGSLKHIIWDSGVDWDGNVSTLDFTFTVVGSATTITAEIPVAKTGQITVYQSGDDATFQHGVSWPSPRYTDTGNGTAIDNLTGLEWVKAPALLAGNASTKDWNTAVLFCSFLSYAGTNDWRLPSHKELFSMIDFGQSTPPLPSGHPFSGIVIDDYWTGSTHPSFSTHAGATFMTDGSTAHKLKTSSQRVWPVRGGSALYPAPVPKTAQTYSYVEGDDGELQTGVAWPSPRFTDTGDGTVIDHLTALEWIKEPHSVAGNAAAMSWSNALVFCEGLTFAAQSNWRQPNIKELESLTNWGTQEPYAWLNSTATPFAGIKLNSYWSSTSRDISVGWYGNMYFLNGIARAGSKGSNFYVIPVRDATAGTTSEVVAVAIASTDSRDYTLSISSAYGSPDPASGIHSNYCWMSTVTGTVDGVVMVGGTNFSCSGWTGTGLNQVLGSGTNTGPVVLTTVSSTLDWKWIVDEDADRMPDDWELQYFGSETAGVATNDVDGDGYLNWQEYILGSNPTNGGSSFLFTPSPSQPTNTAFSIDFTTVTGRLYTVECTYELGSGNWQVLTNFIGDGSAVQFIDPVNLPACFYQIQIDWVE